MSKWIIKKRKTHTHNTFKHKRSKRLPITWCNVFFFLSKEYSNEIVFTDWVKRRCVCSKTYSKKIKRCFFSSSFFICIYLWYLFTAQLCIFMYECIIGNYSVSISSFGLCAHSLSYNSFCLNEQKTTTSIRISELTCHFG